MMLVLQSVCKDSELGIGSTLDMGVLLKPIRPQEAPLPSSKGSELGAPVWLVV